MLYICGPEARSRFYERTCSFSALMASVIQKLDCCRSGTHGLNEEIRQHRGRDGSRNYTSHMWWWMWDCSSCVLGGSSICVGNNERHWGNFWQVWEPKSYVKNSILRNKLQTCACTWVGLYLPMHNVHVHTHQWFMCSMDTLMAIPLQQMYCIGQCICIMYLHVHMYTYIMDRGTCTCACALWSMCPLFCFSCT